jgi:hypothetical protein
MASGCFLNSKRAVSGEIIRPEKADVNTRFEPAPRPTRGARPDRRCRKRSIDCMLRFRCQSVGAGIVTIAGFFHQKKAQYMKTEIV